MNKSRHDGKEPRSEFVVETRDLTKVYGDADKVHALAGVDLRVRRGELLSIVGPSGSGKSTLLNILGALDRPTSGEVIINGTPLTEVGDLDHFRGQTVGFVFQTHNLIPTLTALENVMVPMYETSLNEGKRKARARELLEIVGLGNRVNHLPNQLSGGERQRVAIARALANRPALILADEPTGNLDTKNTADIMALVRELNATQGTTFILVTHNHEVARVTRRVVTLRDGRIVGDVPLASELDSDVYDLKQSALGHAMLERLSEEARREGHILTEQELDLRFVAAVKEMALGETESG
jgi:ABC-type lipoprotein export system ATPase subunit